eukprot:35129_1
MSLHCKHYMNYISNNNSNKKWLRHRQTMSYHKNQEIFLTTHIQQIFGTNSYGTQTQQRDHRTNFYGNSYNNKYNNNYINNNRNNQININNNNYSMTKPFLLNNRSNQNAHEPANPNNNNLCMNKSFLLTHRNNQNAYINQ